MTPQEKRFKKEYAKELLRIAKADLESAVAWSQVGAGRPENIAFVAQQCIEKSIKSVLCDLQIGIPLVHDLGALIAKLPLGKLPPTGYELNELNEYATVRRYEEGTAELTKSDLKKILETARSVYEWAEHCLFQKS